MTHAILVVLVLAYVAWRVYMRVRRNIGQQKFRPRRMVWLVSLFAAGTLGSGFLAFDHHRLLTGWICGLIPGLLLGIWGFRLTRFETKADDRYYTPNGRIGAALTLIFMARLAYRALALESKLMASGFPAPAAGQSALTYFTFELWAGYNIAYGTSLLRKFRLIPAAADPAADPAA